jgi:hypothetical protein
MSDDPVLRAIEALRGDLLREMEANTTSILSDVSRQVASIIGEIQQLRDAGFVDLARTERLERVGEGQNDLARAVAGLARQVHDLAGRMGRLERDRGFHP